MLQIWFFRLDCFSFGYMGKIWFLLRTLDQNGLVLGISVYSRCCKQRTLDDNSVLKKKKKKFVLKHFYLFIYFNVLFLSVIFKFFECLFPNLSHIVLFSSSFIHFSPICHTFSFYQSNLRPNLSRISFFFFLVNVACHIFDEISYSHTVLNVSYT